MSVAYETGAATSPTDLLNKLITFAELQGWNAQAPFSGDTVMTIGATDVGIFAGIDADATSWITRGCMGFSVAQPYDEQPGHSGVSHSVNWGAGPYTAYHFYVGDEGGSDYIHVTVEVESGIYRHWALGKMVPFGAVVGGIYSDSTFLELSENYVNTPTSNLHRYICDSSSTLNNAQAWADHDGLTNVWQVLSSGNAFDAAQWVGSARDQSLFSSLVEIGHQRWNLRTPLWPLVYFANRAASLRTPVGRMPNFRQVNMRNFFHGELVTIGTETWQVFPVFQKQTEAVALDVVSSGLYGYAHLR